MPAARPDPSEDARRITQGHPSYAEPGADKGGQTGGRTPAGQPSQAADAVPDAGASADDPGRGGD